MVYTRINGMMRNVSTANIEEHKYAILSRLFQKPDLHLILQIQKKLWACVIQFIYFDLNSSAY